MLTSKFINLAVAEAHKSTGGKRTGAVIFRGGVVVSLGRYNSKIYYPGSNNRYRLQAEMSAMINAHRTVRGTSMLVVSLNSKGKCINGRPSREMIAIMLEKGIENIYYSTSDGFRKVTF